MKHSILEAFEKGQKLIKSSNPDKLEHWKVCVAYKWNFYRMYVDFWEDLNGMYYYEQLNNLLYKHFYNEKDFIYPFTCNSLYGMH